MYVGQIPIFVTGRRKATSRWCPDCAAWHDTPRGLRPEGDCQARPHGAEPVPARYIRAERLGDVRRARVRVPISPGGVGTPVVTHVR